MGNPYGTDSRFATSKNRIVTDIFHHGKLFWAAPDLALKAKGTVKGVAIDTSASRQYFMFKGLDQQNNTLS
jgi:hypothetical protein